MKKMSSFKVLKLNESFLSFKKVDYKRDLFKLNQFIFVHKVFLLQIKEMK